MNKKIIYIAGKISGEDRQACIEKFAKAQKEIELQGGIALNPIEFVGDWNTPWEIAMRMCVSTLMTADAVLFLPCWKDSKGARIEYKLCEDLGIVKTIVGSI